MSEIVILTTTLEKKISNLFSIIENLETRNKMLQSELSNSIKANNQQLASVEVLKKDFETLKMTNSILGSDDYKRDTKLKINSLIREIDYCIAQLAD